MLSGKGRAAGELKGEEDGEVHLDTPDSRCQPLSQTRVCCLSSPLTQPVLRGFPFLGAETTAGRWPGSLPVTCRKASGI